MEDAVPNTFPQLFIGYTVIWGFLALYVLRLGLKLKQIERSGK